VKRLRRDLGSELCPKFSAILEPVRSSRFQTSVPQSSVTFLVQFRERRILSLMPVASQRMATKQFIDEPSVKPKRFAPANTYSGLRHRKDPAGRDNGLTIPAVSAPE
jgi:hypothetical protein